MSEVDDFRKQAEDCRQLAARSVKPEDKAFWLTLAEDWMLLAQNAENTASRRKKE